MNMKLNETYYSLVNAIIKGSYTENEIKCKLNEFINTLTDFSANKPKYCKSSVKNLPVLKNFVESYVLIDNFKTD